MSGADALRVLIPEMFAIQAVVQRQTQDALLGALRAQEDMIARGIRGSTGQSLVNAYRHLCERAALVPPELITAAAQAYDKMCAAMQAYDAMIRPIRDIVLVKESLSNDGDSTHPG
jgi:hypothetical protein